MQRNTQDNACSFIMPHAVLKEITTLIFVMGHSPLLSGARFSSNAESPGLF
ncbi:hypothetical protein SAMN06265380_107127 [Ruegeria faecimaris]|uniref:Uncharacterized protein n=1 Tax=Ruegeria faecimaris TaxID=686389 RepID=A0A521DUQ7_9RHOB|nr:hypothetical protein SAMN06265380_107127 [Ruegeria faecimaris]